MREPTKACIDMAPRVAEIMGPWEPKEGDWLITEMREVCVIGSDDVLPRGEEYLREITWLPTLEQCLDWLREHDCIIELDYDKDSMEEDIRVFPPHYCPWSNEKTYTRVFICGWLFMTKPREAAYRAVIAVGEGESE